MNLQQQQRWDGIGYKEEMIIGRSLFLFGVLFALLVLYRQLVDK